MPVDHQIAIGGDRNGRGPEGDTPRANDGLVSVQ